MSSKTAGAPRALKPADEAALVPVALLEGTFGLKGEMKCRPSSAGEPLLRPGQTFWFDPSGSRSAVCAGVRFHQGRPLIRFEGILDATAAEPLAGKHLHVRRADVELAEGEFLDDDLVGMRLISGDGRELGSVMSVEHFPAGDYLAVSPKGALVPMIREFVRAIDPATGTISVSLPDGLLDSSLAEEA